MVTRDLLRRLRNDLPMEFTLRLLGNKAPYSKTVEGRLRFQCPHCGDVLVTINPRNNLAHCFGCRKNINNIDLLIAVGYDFRDTVALLRDWLDQYDARKSGRIIFDPPARHENSITGTPSIGAVLRQEFENRSKPHWDRA